MSKTQRRSAVAQPAPVASASFALINVAGYLSFFFLLFSCILVQCLSSGMVIKARASFQVAEILPRLTAKTPMRFKCASKLYQCIISHPTNVCLDSICYDRQDQLSISLSSLSLPYDDSHKFLASGDDSPGRFDSIQFPSGCTFRTPSLIYSERVRYKSANQVLLIGLNHSRI